jgi:hypothetical protein
VAAASVSSGVNRTAAVLAASIVSGSEKITRRRSVLVQAASSVIGIASVAPAGAGAGRWAFPGGAANGGTLGASRRGGRLV